MQFKAKARYISYSPYKLRPVADVIRGKNAAYALGWLATYRTKRSLDLTKVLESAVANAKNMKNIEFNEIRNIYLILIES